MKKSEKQIGTNSLRCYECGAPSENELCDKCDGEFFMLAHRHWGAPPKPPAPERKDDRRNN